MRPLQEAITLSHRHYGILRRWALVAARQIWQLQVNKNEDKVEKLEKQLKETEEKLALMSDTAGKVFRAADWLNDLLGETIQALSFLTQRAEKSSPSVARVVSLDDTHQ